MSIRIQLRHAAVIFSLIQLSISVASAAVAACYDTPSTAIDAFRVNAPSSQASEGRGFQVTMTQWDPVLGRRWATVASCDHPERPAFAVPLSKSGSPRESLRMDYSPGHSIPVAVVIHAGDIVRLWHQESSLRIETAGVSEESGWIGKTIRLRLLRRNGDDESTPESLLGVVRGPANVEMQP